MSQPQGPEPFQPGGWPQAGEPAPGAFGGPAHQPPAPYGQPGYGQPGYGQPVSPPPYGQQLQPPVGYQPVRQPPSALPDGPREYQQMLRGPRRAWWKPLVAAVLATVFALIGQLVALIPLLVVGAVVAIEDLPSWLGRQLNSLEGGGTEGILPAAFFYLNLSLIAFIPAAGLSIWIVHRIRPGFLSSVTGRFRWRWLARCLIVVVPVWGIYLGLSAYFTEAAPPPSQWPILLVLVIILTPLQAAGEEYLFRGWILQNVGAWFANPMVGLGVGTVVTAAAFALAHGSLDVWVLASLAAFALSAALITWQTGGLEGAIAVHAVNNIGVFLIVLTRGGWSDAFVSGDTKSTPTAFLVELLVQAVVCTLIIWQSRRAKLQRLYLPKLAVGEPTALSALA